MKTLRRFLISAFILFSFLSTGLPCGPGYVSPLFDTDKVPEIPYGDFAAGRLGIVKRKFRRSVLIAAYRHIAGRGLNTPEQKALVEVWLAEMNKKDFRDNSIDEAIKAWVAKRKEALPKEEKLPEIYVERSYGGYEFFPNCTKNAFETAAETLADRMTSYGSTDANVLNWLAGQDQVFQNCASGKRVPDAVPPGTPLWLQKDRDYQIAAAEFYSMNYGEAKRRFAEIALDAESPWRETADYLIARTLIRQASLSPNPAASAPIYDEAEAHLQKFVSASGKFSASAERMQGLIKYRLRPKERISELAKNITVYSGENFRQDVIDYTWLLDKFESEALNAEEARKKASEKTSPANSDESMRQSIETALSALGVSVNVFVVNGEVELTGTVPKEKLVKIMQAAFETGPKKVTNKLNYEAGASVSNSASKKNDGDLEIYIYSGSDAKSWQIYVKPNATDAEALTEAERVIGKPLTDELRTQVREGRQRAYQSRFSEKVKSSYEGGYYGEELFTPSLMPAFLRQDEITEWLFIYQMSGTEAYLHSLKRFEQTGSDLWLMTALAQAEKSSTQLPRLIEAADKTDRSGPAYHTIAYHQARILLAMGKNADARKLIDEMLNLGDSLPISARNSFAEMKLKLVDTLEDFIRYSLKKPYAFDFSGDTGTLDEIIAEQKSYFDPEYNKEGREAYEREVDERYKEERLWESRAMFDAGAVDAINQHFPTASMVEVYGLPVLPDYMKPRFAMVIWMRAYLLNDAATLAKFSPELARHFPYLAPGLDSIAAAKTPAARENALLFFVLKNPILSPFLEDGIGKTDNEVEQWDYDDWWCEPYDSEYNEATNSEGPRVLPPRPAGLKPAQTQAAQAERKKIKATGDAPKFLGNKVLAWARRSPTDKRVPEAIYIMTVANGWSKYGCGNNEELRESLTAIIRTRYANTEWAAKLKEDEGEK